MQRAILLVLFFRSETFSFLSSVFSILSFEFKRFRFSKPCLFIIQDFYTIVIDEYPEKEEKENFPKKEEIFRNWIYNACVLCYTTLVCENTCDLFIGGKDCEMSYLRIYGEPRR
jgi:hypothetical protein